MALTNKENQTREFYNKHAVEWAAERKGTFWQAEMERFHALLPSGKVLEIGSGGGRDAAHLLQLGYDYTGTDVSEGLLKIAKKENPQGKFLHQSVYDLDFPRATFDGFWTAATLLHIPKDRVSEALDSIRNVVKPGGIGFISLKEEQTEEMEERTGRFFAYYQLGEFRQILTASHFDIIEVSKHTK